MSVTKFTLPISPSYVAHWGLWEAVRELYQNALDARDRDIAQGHTGQASIDFREASPGEGTIIIANAGEKLKPSSLILGQTTKADDPGQRGKFGEGYKLAMLVLCRLGLRVEMLNGDEVWTPKIEHDDTFGCEVLNVYTEFTNHPDSGGVRFNIVGVTQEQWDEISSNKITCLGRCDTILDGITRTGQIFVGGLYVCTMKQFRFGYALKAGSIPLDRDRGMVSSFDLSVLTSRLHAEEDSDRAQDLLEEDAADVQYVTHHATVRAPIVVRALKRFTSQHGDATPVTTQAEVERAQTAGIRWVLVKQGVRSLLDKVRKWIIPSRKSPLERLRDFRSEYEFHMSDPMKAELDGILAAMSPPSQPQPAAVKDAE